MGKWSSKCLGSLENRASTSMACNQVAGFYREVWGPGPQPTSQQFMAYQKVSAGKGKRSRETDLQPSGQSKGSFWAHPEHHTWTIYLTQGDTYSALLSIIARLSSYLMGLATAHVFFLVIFVLCENKGLLRDASCPDGWGKEGKSTWFWVFLTPAHGAVHPLLCWP